MSDWIESNWKCFLFIFCCLVSACLLWYKFNNGLCDESVEYGSHLQRIYLCFIGFLWVNEKAFLSCLYVKRWVIEKFVNSLKHEFLRKYNFLFLSLIPLNTTSMFLNSSYKTHLRYNVKVAWRGWFKSEKKTSSYSLTTSFISHLASHNTIYSPRDDMCSCCSILNPFLNIFFHLFLITIPMFE